MTGSWAAASLAGLLGLYLGSLLNVCSLRWPNDESVFERRSPCPACGRTVRWYDNLPVLGWVALRGRCHGCGAPISLQYPLVEAATGLVWGGMIWVHGVEVEALRGALLLTLLLGIAVSDGRFYIIPDQFSLGGVALGLALSLLAPGFSLIQGLSGAAMGFLLLWVVARVGEKAFRKEVMGGGDIKTMAMIGAFLGIEGVLLSLLLGAFLGAVIFGSISYRTGRPVPFGIFLAAAAAATYLWGDAWMVWYAGISPRAARGAGWLCSVLPG